MKKYKVLSLLLAVCMLSLSIVGCSKGETEANTAESTTSTTEKVETAGETGTTVKMLVNVTGGKDEAEMKLFQEALSKATGLNVVMEKPPSDYQKVMMQKLQSGEKYDLIYMSANEYAVLVEQGALTDITDRIAESEILTNNINPSEWKDIEVDGRIYAGFNKKELHRVVTLNNIHLKAAGIDYKTIDPTLDGYYNVLKTLKANNTNPDYYPIDICLAKVNDIQPWMASVGLKHGVVVDETDSKRYVPYSLDESAPVWEWLKKLYEEELMDPASFVDEMKEVREKMGAASQLTSVVSDWAMWVGIQNANAINGGITPDKYEAVSLPGVKTPDGSYMLRKGGASLFGIPANAENPDGAIKVLEYFATQEGGELLSVGILDNDYTIEADGTYKLTETGSTHASDHGAPSPIYKDFNHPVGYNPGVEEALTYLQYATIDSDPGDEVQSVVGKWGIQMVKGEVTVEEGLKSMREELVSLGLCDK